MGQALCRTGVAGDWNVRALIRSPLQRQDLPIELRDQAVLADLLDTESLSNACDSIHTILHLAGEAHVGNEHKQPSTHSIVVTAENLLTAALQAGVRRIVFLSSSLAESAASGVGDVTAYGKAKLAAEALFSNACIKGEIETVILRPVNVYGVGMKGNIASMISMIAGGRLPPLPSRAGRISLLGVQDLVQAIILAMNSENMNGRTFMITDGQAYSISEIEAAIYQVLGKTAPRWRTPAVILYAASVVAGLLSKAGLRQGSISARTYRNLMNDNLFDNASICKELGFEPSIDLYDALPEIVENIVSTSEQQNKSQTRTK